MMGLREMAGLWEMTVTVLHLSVLLTDLNCFRHYRSIIAKWHLALLYVVSKVNTKF